MSFYKKYIMLNLNEYDSFEGFDFYITFFLAFLTIGLCIGIFISNHRKNVMIRIVKQLYRHGAISEESAKTLSELRIPNTHMVRHLISSDSRLSKIVCRVGEIRLSYDEYVAELKAKKKAKRKKRIAERESAPNEKEEKIDYSIAKFYICSDREADAKHILSKNTTSVCQNILICIFFICLTVCLTLIMPELLSLLDSLLS